MAIPKTIQTRIEWSYSLWNIFEGLASSHSRWTRVKTPIMTTCPQNSSDISDQGRPSRPNDLKKDSNTNKSERYNCEAFCSICFRTLHWCSQSLSTWWVVYLPEKWWSLSVGMIFPFPTEWKNNPNVSNHHQPWILHFSIYPCWIPSFFMPWSNLRPSKKGFPTLPSCT